MDFDYSIPQPTMFISASNSPNRIIKAATSCATDKCISHNENVEFAEGKENIPQNIMRKSGTFNLSPVKFGQKSPRKTITVPVVDNQFRDKIDIVKAIILPQEIRNLVDENENVVCSDKDIDLNLEEVLADSPFKAFEEAVGINDAAAESPSTIISKLKKGQRVKDGMILLLSGQVDRRKQLLLGAQEEAQKMSKILEKKEVEVVTLQTQVRALQSSVQGADGKIALLKFQLQKAKQIGITAARKDVLTVDSSNGLPVELKNVPDLELKNVPHSSAFASPDRQAWLLHFKRSCPLRTIIVTSSESRLLEPFLSDEISPFLLSSNNPGKLNLNFKSTVSNNSNFDLLLNNVINNNDKTQSDDNIENPVESLQLPLAQSLPQSESQSILESSTEYKIAVQERLNVRLQEQLRSWVESQIDLHKKMSQYETTNTIEIKQKNIFEKFFDGGKFDEIMENKKILDEEKIKDENDLKNYIENSIKNSKKESNNSFTNNDAEISFLSEKREIYDRNNETEKNNDKNSLKNNNYDESILLQNSNETVDRRTFLKGNYYQEESTTNSPKNLQNVTRELFFGIYENNILQQEVENNGYIENANFCPENNNIVNRSDEDLNDQIFGEKIAVEKEKIQQNPNNQSMLSEDSVGKIYNKITDVENIVAKEVVKEVVKVGNLNHLSPTQMRLLTSSNTKDKTENKIKSETVNSETAKPVIEKENREKNIISPQRKISTPGNIFQKLIAKKSISSAEKPGLVQGPKISDSSLMSQRRNNDVKSSVTQLVSAEDHSSLESCKEHSSQNQVEEYTMRNYQHYDNVVQAKAHSQETTKEHSLKTGEQSKYHSQEEHSATIPYEREYSAAEIFRQKFQGCFEERSYVEHSLVDSEAYRNLPLGRRSLSRERGANTHTQHRSALLQERLKALEIETQKEREKNRSQILLLQIREKRMKNQNHSSTPASKILSPQSNKKNQKTRKYNYDGESVNSETVKITPRQTPRKSPKSKGVVSTFEVGMMNREIVMPYSPLQRPTLSPISFGKEMTRLKNENYSIKDDIARFRNTLQKLKNECSDDTTSQYNQGVQQFHIMSDMVIEKENDNIVRHRY